MKCKKCGKTFVNSKRYNTHVTQNKCPIKPCTICNLTFISDIDLGRHQKTKGHLKKAGLLETEENPILKKVGKLEKNLREKTKEVEDLNNELQELKNMINKKDIPPLPSHVVNNVTNNIVNNINIFILNDTGVNDPQRIKNLTKKLYHVKNPEEVCRILTNGVCNDNDPPIYRKPNTTIAICGDTEYELVEIIPEIKEGVIVRSQKVKESLGVLTEEADNQYKENIEKAKSEYDKQLESRKEFLKKKMVAGQEYDENIKTRLAELSELRRKALDINETRKQTDDASRANAGNLLSAVNPNDTIIAEYIPLLAV
nr:hypothetical protein K-LCC10_0190 [Kaumoebavirus]